MQVVCDTLILSDLHLGSEISRSAEALELLQSARFRRLILLGDIFADLNFRRLTKEHWEFLSHIRKLSNPRRRKEVVWVEGNHDHGLSEVMSHLVGIPVAHSRWRACLPYKPHCGKIRPLVPSLTCLGYRSSTRLASVQSSMRTFRGTGTAGSWCSWESMTACVRPWKSPRWHRF
jgi:hypothetical protein